MEHHRGAAATPLRRPRRAQSCAVSLTESAQPGRAPDPALHAAAHAMLAAHLEGEVAREPWVQAVEYDATIPRWYVRFGCDGRDAATIYFDLYQRTLRFELYFVPDPPGNHEAL